jgi:hypothetical protein
LEEEKSFGRKYKPFVIGKTIKKLSFVEDRSPTHCQGVIELLRPLWGSI